RIAAAEAVVSARAAWMGLVAARRACVADTKPIVDALRKYIGAVHGSSMEALADFGILPTKRRTLSSAELVETVGKARATRQARDTMGTRQKRRVTGSIAVIAPDPHAAEGGAASTSTQANGSTNGVSNNGEPHRLA